MIFARTAGLSRTSTALTMKIPADRREFGAGNTIRGGMTGFSSEGTKTFGC